MGERNFEVYGLGQCCLDYIGRVDAYPPADTKCEVREMVVQGGGPVATALVALARWGVRCTIASVIGDDEFGSAIKASLEDEGVDTSGLIMRKGFDSQFSYIAAEPGAGTRTVFWRRPTGAPPRFDELDHARIHGAKLLHTDGLFMEASLAAATAAKEAGVQSEKLAGELVGGDRPVDACFELAALGPRVVGVTLGHRGYVALHGKRIIERPAYPVDPVDTTGCGDVFHAGFTYGVIKGWDVERSLDFGAWAAAMVSLQLGGRTGIPPKSEYPRINPRSS
jgi:ribokinase